MGSSGLLLLGIVALWAFGAVPHWVQRRERLAAAWEAQASDDELRLLERRELSRTTTSAPVRSTGRLLATPRVSAEAPPQTAAEPAPTGKGSRPVALPAVAALLATGVVAAAPALLAVLGVVPLAAAPSGLLALALGVAVLRRRASVREAERATARRAAAQARTRAAQVRAADRRVAAGRAAVVAQAASASAAAAARTFAAEQEARRPARTAAPAARTAPRRRAVGE